MLISTDMPFFFYAEAVQRETVLYIRRHKICPLDLQHQKGINQLGSILAFISFALYAHFKDTLFYVDAIRGDLGG